MKPDREDHSAAPAGPRDTRLRDTRLRDTWRRRSLAGGWLTPDDWHSEAVDAVLTACRQVAAWPWPAPGWARPGLATLPYLRTRLRRSVQATFGTQIRMTPLPGRLTEALRLVDKLAR